MTAWTNSAAITDEFVLMQTAALERGLEKLVDSGAVPAIGAVVSIGGRRITAFRGCSVAEKGQALTSDSRWQISCLMKLFSSVIALQLVKEGQLNLDSRLCEFLPELSITAPIAVERIRIKHLISHTSGYWGTDLTEAAVKWNYSWPKLIERLASGEQLFRPGAVFNYEHSEHVILGHILKQLTGASLEALVQSRLYDPLEIFPASPSKDKVSGRWISGYERRPNNGGFVPANPLAPSKFWKDSISDQTLTLMDLTKIGEALFQEAGKPTISRTRDFLTTEIVLLPNIYAPRRSERLPTSFTLGCSRFADGSIGHNGSAAGQTCALRILPSYGAVIAVGLNVWAPDIRDAVIDWLIGAICERSATAEGDRANVSLGKFMGGFTPGAVIGTYLGSSFGKLAVHYQQGVLTIETEKPNNGKALIEARFNEGRCVAIRSSLPVPSGFFPNIDDGIPCFQFGMSAYKLRPIG